MNTYHIEYKHRALDVEVEMGPAEPDGGSGGNGRVAISVEGIRDAAGDCVLGDYSPLEIEDIAHEVYAILGEHQ